MIKLLTYMLLIANSARIAKGKYDNCTTPDQKLGRCIPEADCPFHEDLGPASEDCPSYGLTPRVCCPIRACDTPNGHSGTCVRVDDCPEIVTMLRKRTQDSREYLMKANCNLGRLSVCCKNDDVYPMTKHNERCNVEVFMNSRITGGEEASLSDYPWMVLLEYIGRYDGALTTDCAGSLITDRHVLTAAHCLHINDMILKSVRLGEYDTGSNKDCDWNFNCADDILSIDVQKAVAHPNYAQGTNAYHDIAIITMETTVPYTFYVSPACMPLWNPVPSNGPIYTKPVMAQAAGWGKSEMGVPSEVKHHVSLQLVPRDECNRLYEEEDMEVNVAETQICAGGGDDGSDTCSGDSGGPLMLMSGDMWHLIGVVSYGPKNCGTKAPGVYTNVYWYRKWIWETVNLK